MSTLLTPQQTALGGTAVLMACACGAATNSAKLVAMTGLGATNRMVHPIFIGAAAGLILLGLWRMSRRSAYIAAGAFAILAIAAILTPPMVMTMNPKTSAGGVPWHAMQMFGGSLYLVAAAFLGYAFWRAFPSPEPGASATSIGGMAAATGCTCCMVTGATSGMAVTLGASTVFNSMPIIFWSGLAVVAIGLFRLGGVRAAMWVPAGGLIIELMPDVLRLTGDWMVGTVNMRFIPGYLFGIAGAGVVLHGFVVAYELAGERARTRVPSGFGAEPSYQGAGGD